jgi:hypothetical protein
MVLAPAFVFQGIGHFFPGFQGMWEWRGGGGFG